MIFLAGCVFIILVFGGSYLLTKRIRAHALAYNRLALPNGRSSHTEPTPLGGGLSLVLIFISVVIACIGLSPQYRSLWLALLGGIPVAVVGWLDDRRGMSLRLRLFVHIAAALWALFHLRSLNKLDLGYDWAPLGLLGPILMIVGIVWSINLYNFMDGIDGLAGGQALITATAAGWFSLSGAVPVALVCWTLAAAVGGFLYWNWPAARIFMGDVGSGTLGFFFAVLALWGEQSGTLPLFVWLILLGPFWVDTTFTLIRRVLQGEKWYMGHRTHAYQRAVQRGYSHAQVTLSILSIDLVLIALASFVLLYPKLLFPTWLLVLLLLFYLWYHFTATQVVAKTR